MQNRNESHAQTENVQYRLPWPVEKFDTLCSWFERTEKLTEYMEATKEVTQCRLDWRDRDLVSTLKSLSYDLEMLRKDIEEAKKELNREGGAR